MVSLQNSVRLLGLIRESVQRRGHWLVGPQRGLSHERRQGSWAQKSECGGGVEDGEK